VFLDYFDAASSTSTLTVTFRRCDFVDNTYFGLPAQPALIVGNSLQNHLEFYDCNFERNDMTFNNTMVGNALVFRPSDCDFTYFTYWPVSFYF